jgi:hypothetical protein
MMECVDEVDDLRQIEWSTVLLTSRYLGKAGLSRLGIQCRHAPAVSHGKCELILLLPSTQ